jgi:hypothetical protein
VSECRGVWKKRSTGESGKRRNGESEYRGNGVLGYRRTPWAICGKGYSYRNIALIHPHERGWVAVGMDGSKKRPKLTWPPP